MAKVFNNPSIVLCAENHSGTRPSCFSFSSADTENIQLTTLKHAEYENGLILCGASYREEAKSVKLRILGREQEINVAPHELFILRIQEDSAILVNIPEE